MTDKQREEIREAYRQEKEKSVINKIFHDEKHARESENRKFDHPHADYFQPINHYRASKSSMPLKLIVGFFVVCLVIALIQNGSLKAPEFKNDQITPEQLSKGLNEYIAEATKEPDISTIEQLTFQKVNAIRGSNLKWNSQLASIARSHSEDMASRNFFDHDNPDGDGPTERAKKAGIQTEIDKGAYIAVGIGENISMVPTGNVIGCGSVYTEEEIADCAAEGWRDSPGHYANIIDREYTETGMGVGVSGSTYYLTQTFR